MRERIEIAGPTEGARGTGPHLEIIGESGRPGTARGVIVGEQILARAGDQGETTLRRLCERAGQGDPTPGMATGSGGGKGLAGAIAIGFAYHRLIGGNADVAGDLEQADLEPGGCEPIEQLPAKGIVHGGEVYRRICAPRRGESRHKVAASRSITSHRACTVASIVVFPEARPFELEGMDGGVGMAPTVSSSATQA